MQQSGRATIEECPGGGQEVSTPAGDDIRERIVRIYTSVSPGGRMPRDDEPGDLDSMAFLEFIMSLEREFGIEVAASDLDETNFATGTATAAYVRRKLGEGRP